MAATDIVPTALSRAGVADTTVSADGANGNSWTNTGYEFAEVINGSGSPITVTADAFPSGGTAAPDSLTVTDPTVTIAAGVRKKIGPFKPAYYNNASNKVVLTFSSATTVTIGVYSLSPTP